MKFILKHYFGRSLVESFEFVDKKSLDDTFKKLSNEILDSSTAGEGTVDVYTDESTYFKVKFYNGCSERLKVTTK